MYVAQTFHFAGPPKVTTHTTAAAPRKAVHSNRIIPGGKPRTVTVKTDTILPDDQAVRLLLAGVAGSLRDPREIFGPRDMFSASEVKYLQALSPPAKPSAAQGITAPLSPIASNRSSWTMTLLWPTDKNTLNAGRKTARKRGKRQGE